MRRDRRRAVPRGFTLVECLAVIAIIGLLVGLLLPAVMAARESGRRAACQDRLKQVGIALANFHAARGAFPAGMRPTPRSDGILIGYSLAFSASAQVLPFLEQAALYNAINFEDGKTADGQVLFRANALSHENGTAREMSLDAFLCPSDGGVLVPGSNVRFCIGAQPLDREGPLGPGGGGAFPGVNATSARDFLDGLSNVVGASERLRGSDLDPSKRHLGPDGDWSGRFDRTRDVWYSRYSDLGESPDNTRMAEVCASLTSSLPEAFVESGRYWIGSNYEETLYNHVLGPNAPAPDCSESGPGSFGNITGGAISARGAHAGGVHALLMDGGVRFVRDGIDIRVWRALATRAGGEPIGAY